jgi:Cd2+/Zn2+-exporting ATPase
MLRRAQRELYLVLADPILDLLREEIVAAHRRGVALGTVLTGTGDLDVGQVVRHPPLESQLHELAGTWLVVVDGEEALVVNSTAGISATATRSRNLVLIARQFVWMEMFAQRIFGRLGPELLSRLDPDDRRIFEMSQKEYSP